MYIDSIKIENFRNFNKCKVDFLHSESDFKGLGVPKPKLPNINLLLGNNGQGKTSLLKAIALACLGPAVADAGIYAYKLVRIEPAKTVKPKKKIMGFKEYAGTAVIKANFTPHEIDLDENINVQIVESHTSIKRRGDLEQIRWTHQHEKSWHPIYESNSESFFFVGYGATRRVESKDRHDSSSRNSSTFARAQRIKSLFEDSYSLTPLSTWLPKISDKKPKKATEAINLINSLLGTDHFQLTGEMENGEYLFRKGGLEVPYPALSDGYQAFLGWIGDLLFHLCSVSPKNKPIKDLKGIVMVDEIDLHLHPKWQMSLLPKISKHLPNIQFIFTSHSPLLVGSLEWMNILLMTPGKDQSSRPKRLEYAVHGLDADQILLTDFFGLNTTRTRGKNQRLKSLTNKAFEGDTKAAIELLKEMTHGKEHSE